jgi:hypothetical protein
MNTHIFKLLQFFFAAPPTPYFGKIRQKAARNGHIIPLKMGMEQELHTKPLFRV